MPHVASIDAVIEKLKGRTEPLSVEHCHKLSEWLTNYMLEHDNGLIYDAFIRVNKQGKLDM